MKTTLEQVKIVEYHEGLAKGIAKMWNESRGNWGGDSTITTEQDVKDKEANSTNLHLFLAMVGEEVAGYCGLSEYREDEGALYIPLLNVHPAFQGMKIGKKLVLKAIEKTVELKWPRLDLFTWPGNTKAVPLYKKCGFFWEDRDDAVHLMNFIPSVLQIDLLKPFFNNHDWYETSQRVIEIKPDALKLNDHTYYEYKWEAGDEFVRIQFERTGRGIRLIETQDILVEMILPEFKLLENQDHILSYHVENRSKEPVEVSIKGVSSSIVKHDLEDTFLLENKWVKDLPARVSMPANEPSPWKTHPTVGAEIEINKKPVSLKMGVFPKQAGKLHLRSLKKNWKPQSKGTIYLDIESQVGENTIWTVKLPQNEVVSWENPEVMERIAGFGKVSVPISAELIKNGFLSEEIGVTVEWENGKRATFTTLLRIALPGYGAKFGGETDEHWIGFNGPHYVEIERRNHTVKIGSTVLSRDPISFFTPKLGKPYSDEFAKKEASSVEFIDLPEALVIKTSLLSESFDSILLNTYFKMYGDGLVEIKHEIVNKGTMEKERLSLIQPAFFSFEGIAIPQNDGVLIGNEPLVPFMEYIDDKAISERWLFIKSSKGESISLAWPAQALGRKDDWRFALEYQLENLRPNEEICLGPIQVGINTSTHWSKWRELLGYEESELQELPLYAFEKSKGDAVSSVNEVINYRFRSLMTPYIHGTFTVQNGHDTIVRDVQKDQGVTQLDLQLTHSSPGVKMVSGEFVSTNQLAKVDSLQFVYGVKEVNIEQKDDNWVVDNGVISFQACANYFPGIYSLKLQGNEALDHQYPKPGPRAWWNPWGGGIAYSFQSISAYSLLKEETTIEQVNRVDRFGHQWSGICISTAFSKHDKMKGVTLRQYALTLPEVPILAVYAEIHQNSGQTIVKELLDLDAFFKTGETLQSSYVSLPTEGVFNKYYAGTEEFVLRDSPYAVLGCDEHEETISFIHTTNRKQSEAYVNQDALLVASTNEWSAADGETIKIEPTILFYGEIKDTNSIRTLHNIQFR
ncbi:GNAT family N-acetyltransferase [Rossellomorea aquimaris]|uniref:GNAT family N-acetyltransferase n=1 Tax=Rossellomorea aquimaris TaxID=189382 RepID=UPI001CFC7810|nr:GNAT family N-acetyltransferase [Rossellomorea aquimaris]